MRLLNDLHHMTFLTGDMNRLLSFYDRVFDATVTFDRTEEDPPRRRHAFIEIGPHTVLHPFQVDGVDPPPRQPIFLAERGVPDTVDGRFELVALHAFLVFNRLRADHAATAEFGRVHRKLVFICCRELSGLAHYFFDAYSVAGHPWHPG